PRDSRGFRGCAKNSRRLQRTTLIDRCKLRRFAAESLTVVGLGPRASQRTNDDHPATDSKYPREQPSPDHLATALPAPYEREDGVYGLPRSSLRARSIGSAASARSRCNQRYG